MEYREWKDRQLVNGTQGTLRSDRKAITGNKTRPIKHHGLKRRTISCPALLQDSDDSLSQYTNEVCTGIVSLATDEAHPMRTRKTGAHSWQQDDRGYHSEDLLAGDEDILSMAEKGLGVIPISRLNKANSCRDLCAICLDEFLDNDNIRGLACNHTFHATCVDGWLLGHRANCPVCQAECCFNTSSRTERQRRDELSG